MSPQTFDSLEVQSHAAIQHQLAVCLRGKETDASDDHFPTLTVLFLLEKWFIYNQPLKSPECVLPLRR